MNKILDDEPVPTDEFMEPKRRQRSRWDELAITHIEEQQLIERRLRDYPRNVPVASRRRTEADSPRWREARRVMPDDIDNEDI